MGTRFALAVTSGTAALTAALAALQVGPGDEVILPAWTWHSCFNAIVLAGALPVFGEIDESFNLDPNDLERKITPQTKVILAVHLQGNPCDSPPA
jgi:8-amino-3,8-dideoxy-alpha-D-manno-octulosonate transaminase